MTGWLIIIVAVLAVWAAWGVFNIVANCVEYWNAARKSEAESPRGERGV